jgi:Zn-dependent M28 family amino/carboxypeptidase
MKKLAIAMLLAALTAGAQASQPPKKAAADKPATKFSGKDALAYTVMATEYGPRPSGSPALDKTRQFIEASLASWKLKPEIDQFVASTPVGKVPMYNYIVKIPATDPAAVDHVVMVAGHYDTKRFKDIKFVGANDGGSSMGVLLELARVLSLTPRKEVSVWIVFHDGEEAQLGPWTKDDSLWGAKHLVTKLQASGDVKKIKALINIDMIGNKNLSMLRDTFSTEWLNDLVRDAAKGIGLGTVFNNEVTDIEDDHLPYLKAGVASVDLIDFTSMNTFWHNEKDTSDKLSAASMEQIGLVVLASIDALAKR